MSNTISVALAQPDESAGLQILSDWYEEQGDPRGEITRLCSELATCSASDPRHRRIMTRLWAKNNFYLGYLRRKTSDVDCHLALGNQQTPFDAPFKVTITAAELLRCGEYLLAALPPLYDLDIRGEPEDLAELAGQPVIGGIVGIGHLDIQLQESHAELLASPHLTNLNRLDVFSEHTLEAACRSPQLGTIRKLAIKRFATEATLRFLQHSPLLNSLQRIEIDSPAAIDDAYIKLWVDTFSKCTLTSIGLGRFVESQLGFPLEELFPPEISQSLKWLCIQGEFDPTSLLQNALGANAAKLQKLLLRKSNWGDASRLVLFERLDQLRWLVLAESNLGEAAAEVWAKRPLENLQYLDLSGTRWNDHAMQLLLNGKPWPRLETLLLHNTKMTSACIEHFIANWKDTFPRLSRLVVGPFHDDIEHQSLLREAMPFAEIVPGHQS